MKVNTVTAPKLPEKHRTTVDLYACIYTMVKIHRCAAVVKISSEREVWVLAGCFCVNRISPCQSVDGLVAAAATSLIYSAIRDS